MGTKPNRILLAEICESAEESHLELFLYEQNKLSVNTQSTDTNYGPSIWFLFENINMKINDM